MTFHSYAETLFLLYAGHALADFPLQGDFMAKAKGDPEIGWIVLPLHAMIHGAAVILITGSAWLGLAETLAHLCIDKMKLRGRISFQTDQIMHLACKFLWVLAMWAAP